jgi:uncharacterized membrane protein YeaQ/YmgE (transglycosylase-associated protein family)|tara:strand:- start:313 stop:585 length:273 start_codon:yes stop_codon:yes gene_type:complete
MGAIWTLVSLLAVWLLYGLLASLFVKGITSRDAIPLLLSGMIGGAVGGQISTFMNIPDNIWWFSELIKFLLTIFSLYIISIYWSKRKSKS